MSAKVDTELDDEARALFAIACGVPYTVHQPDARTIKLTTEPCCIRVIAGQICVFVAPSTGEYWEGGRTA